MGEYIEKVEKIITDLELESIAEAIQAGIDSGEDPQALLDAMCSGMGKVGELFEGGEYFLADLVLAGETMKEGVAVLEPHLKTDAMGQKGCVVICTVKGDIHDIGKNLVGTMLSSAGFQVVDLGVDVHEDKVVEAVRDNSASVVGLSVLLTSMVNSIGDVVSALSSAGMREEVKIMIGGACTTSELAKKMGVDALGQNAVEAVRICEGFKGS